MKIASAKKYVIDFFHSQPRQDLSREEIIQGVMRATKNTVKPKTIDRIVSEITEFNKEGIVHSDIYRLVNGKFKYIPKSATLTEFL